MAIKNTDGTVFKLRGPNPIVKDQEFWDGYALHNFKYNEVVTKEGDRMRLENLEDIEPEEIIVPVPAEMSKKKSTEEQILKHIDKIMMYCLPAILKEHHDTLYGETRTSLSYGKQFTFEAIIVERSSLSFKIWTNTNIGRGSIIFVPADRDWWKVENSEVQSGGATIKCSPSDTQPSFG